MLTIQEWRVVILQHARVTPLCRAAVHGQVATELAEPYYLYGRALLELARCLHYVSHLFVYVHICFLLT